MGEQCLEVGGPPVGKGVERMARLAERAEAANGVGERIELAVRREETLSLGRRELYPEPRARRVEGVRRDDREVSIVVHHRPTKTVLELFRPPTRRKGSGTLADEFSERRADRVGVDQRSVDIEREGPGHLVSIPACV